MGGTTGSWAFGTSIGAILDREYSYVTPENDFKQHSIHPDNSATWRWAQADAWVDHIADKGQTLRIHGPIGPQCSRWAKNDARTASELDVNMRAYMAALCKRYNGVPGFQYLDVVNETVVNGAWHKDKPGLSWECPWYRIGLDADPNATPSYIAAAFEIAQQYAPDIKLIYNHHEAPERTSSWTLIKQTIAYLRDRGLRVDGIGWQAHVDTGWASEENLAALRNLIDWAHDNALEFHITEASAWLKDGCASDDLQAQAATYRAILDVLLEKRSGGQSRLEHMARQRRTHVARRMVSSPVRCQVRTQTRLLRHSRRS